MSDPTVLFIEQYHNNMAFLPEPHDLKDVSMYYELVKPLLPQPCPVPDGTKCRECGSTI